MIGCHYHRALRKRLLPKHNEVPHSRECSLDNKVGSPPQIEGGKREPRLEPGLYHRHNATLESLARRYERVAVTRNWRLAPLAGVMALLGQILYAAHRPDLPSYDNYETSAALGDPGLPGLKMVAIGDSSITAPGVRRIEDAWIRRVADGLTERYFVHLKALAVGGSKASDVLSGQLTAALAFEPDLAIVSVAANDAIRAVSPTRFRRELDGIVKALLDTGSRVVIVGVGDLGSIPRLPGFLRWYLTQRSAQFDRISAEVAARHPGVTKADMRGELSDAFWRDPMMFSGDRFHASSHGHEHFAHHVSRAVDRALGVSDRV